MDDKNQLLSLVGQRYNGDLSGYLTKKPEKKAPEKIKAKKQDNSEEKEFIAADKDYQAALAYIKDVISPAFMKVYPDKIRVNDTFAKTFFVHAYPSFLE